MLRNAPLLDLVRREMRLRVCPRCHLRPRHSETLGPEAVRPCELTCPIFVHLPALRLVAVCHDPMLGPTARALRRRIDETRAATAGGGGDGDDSSLSRYRDQVVEGLVDVVGAT
jgi:hypothetical protein